MIVHLDVADITKARELLVKELRLGKETPIAVIEQVVIQIMRDAAIKSEFLARAETLRAAARIAYFTKGGFSANLRYDDSPEEPELLRDEDGPWVLNGDIAKRIESVQLTADGRFQSPEAERLWKEATDREGERLHEIYDGNGRPRHHG